MASIHRQVVEIAEKQGWKPPGYDRVRQIIKSIDPALVTYAHQGAAAYREEYDLLYRREATHANAMWQADHTPLDVLLLDETGKPAKPWLTAIEDDYSRAIVGYRLSFQEATALTTALTLRTAIWRKEDPRWHAYGIPTVFYCDHGSDFTSKHMEQVAADLPMELIFSQVSIPRGRGKIERFFRSVDQLLLQDTPGYAPKGSTGVKARLSLAAFEQRFRTWLLEDYHQRIHEETKCKPAERWEAGGFVPRMPKSLEQLDLLLLTVSKTRRVQQDGIRFQGYRYIDPTLAGYVKEDVVIRYDPADLAEVRVFHREHFICRAICQELAGQTVSLKEIQKARAERRKQVKGGLSTREALVEQYLSVHQQEAPKPEAQTKEPAETTARPRLKRYINE
jgi:putative transposase